MVVEVFVAKSYAEYTLSQHCLLGMDNEKLVTRVGNAAIYGVDKADTPIHFSNKYGACVGGQAAAVEISVNFFGTET